MATLTTGQLAERSQVNVETIRYYERRGIIPAPARGVSGYRQYSEDTVARIRFVKRTQELGFTLDEISELLHLRVDPETSCADIKRRADLKVIEIQEKLRSLKRIKKALNRLAASCSGQGPIGECPILDALGRDEAW